MKRVVRPYLWRAAAAAALLLAACQHPAAEQAQHGQPQEQTPPAGPAPVKERGPAGELLAEGAQVDGKRQGFWKIYQPNSRLARQGYYADGRKQGSWEEFDEQGRLLRAGSYQQDLPHGYWKFFEPAAAADAAGPGPAAGQPLTSEGSFERGQKEGFWKQYRHGKLRQEGFYRHNRKTGTWREYDEAGNLLTEAKFEE